MVVGSGTLDCMEAKKPCFVAVQGEPLQDQNCYHFATGSAFDDLKSHGQDLCLRSKQVYAALATRATANQSEVVLAWDPIHGESSRPYSCLARVTFPGMQLLNSLAVGLVASVIYDHVTDSIITLGFSGSQTIIADQYQASTLRPQLRYSIPISVTWLLHAPKMSDGYLLFLGSETPFVGSIFAVDLRRQMIYQQDPPTAGPSQRPRRWVLPYNKFVERLPENPAMASKQSVLLSCRCDPMKANDLADLAKHRRRPKNFQNCKLLTNSWTCSLLGPNSGAHESEIFSQWLKLAFWLEKIR